MEVQISVFTRIFFLAKTQLDNKVIDNKTQDIMKTQSEYLLFYK